MKTKLQSFDPSESYGLSFFLWDTNDGNEKTRARMKNILVRAMETELTDMQRLCVSGYYLGGKKQYVIAEELGLSRSTVCRHIKAAEKKLKGIAGYFYR